MENQKLSTPACHHISCDRNKCTRPIIDHICTSNCRRTGCVLDELPGNVTEGEKNNMLPNCKIINCENERELYADGDTDTLSNYCAKHGEEDPRADCPEAKEGFCLQYGADPKNWITMD